MEDPEELEAVLMGEDINTIDGGLVNKDSDSDHS